MTTTTRAAPARRSPTIFGVPLATFAPLSSLVVILVVAALFAPAFFGPSNLVNVARQAAVLGIVAIGQTFVLLVRGIDLSVGAVMGAAMVIAAEATGGRDDAIWFAVVLAFAIALAIGSANALLVVWRRVPPLVATLAMLILIEGARLAWTQGVPSGSLPTGMRIVGVGRVAGVPIPVLIFAAVAIVAAVVLRRTAYGRVVYATGSNPTAARLSGVRTRLVASSAFILCSLLAMLAGLLLTGYIGYVDRYLGQGFDLDSIAAAVVGGTALTGGRGSVEGTVLGVLFIAALLNVLVLLNAGVAAQLVVKGLVIVGAVALQQRAIGSKG